MSPSKPLHFFVDRAKFFEVGRIFQRNWRVSALGPVTMSVANGTLSIEAKPGCGEMAVHGKGTVAVQLTASKFRRLIISHRHEKSPSGVMKITFDPNQEWLQIDMTGVHCKFLQA